MRKTDPVFFLVVLAGALSASFWPAGRTLAAQARPAQAALDCNTLAPVDWREIRTQSFALVYPAGEENLGKTLESNYGAALDAEYARFAALFNSALQLPVTIRIYPDADQLNCLNAQAGAALPGLTHTHVGSREIALVGAEINANLDAWLRNFINVFRFEQAVLFAEQLSNQKAPPGLLAAVGYYAQDPATTILTLKLNRAEWQAPQHPWNDLWEDPAAQVDFRKGLESLCSVAYLVDAHGWPAFVQLLQATGAAGAYRQPLADVYGKDFSALQAEWRQYFPMYFNGRSAVNAIYNYDLEPLKQLVDAGAYGDAHKALNEVIPFLQKVQQDDKLAAAQALRERAKLGEEAAIQIAQSRQALNAGDYNRSLELIAQAQSRYSQLGNYHRVDEINAYRDQVQQIQNLHGLIEWYRGRVANDWNTIALAGELAAVGNQLGKLGDPQGVAQVNGLAGELEARQRGQQQVLSAFGAGLVLLLLAARIYLLRYRPSPEAEL